MNLLLFGNEVIVSRVFSIEDMKAGAKEKKWRLEYIMTNGIVY